MLPALSEKKKKKLGNSIALQDSEIQDPSHVMTSIIHFNISRRRILKYIVHRIFRVVAQENPNP